MRITYVTTNARKVATLTSHVGPLGFEVEVVGNLDVPEIQADTAAQVAAHKARWAFGALGRPVLVNDFGFFLDALDGWPGTSIKQATQQLGLRRICQLSCLQEAGKPYRREATTARIESALAYCDAGLAEPRVFVAVTKGVMAWPDRPESVPRGALVVDCFVPDGSTVPVGRETRPGAPSVHDGDLPAFIAWLRAHRIRS